MIDESETAEPTRYSYYCPDCDEYDPPVKEDHRSGDVVCKQCGLVLAEKIIDQYSEWRTFANDDNPGESMDRVGGPIDDRLMGGGMSTVIGNRDYHGKTVSKDMTNMMYRVHASGAMSAFDRSLTAAFQAVSRMGDRMELDQPVQELACEFYRELAKKRTLRGKNMESIIASCLYIACRQLNENRTFKEVYTQLNIPRKNITRAYKFVSKTIDIRLDVITTDQYVRRYCAGLKLSTAVANAAQLVAKTIVEEGMLGGRDVITICAVAIYFISQLSDQPRSYKDITEVIRISEQTIRVAYRDLQPNAAKLIPTNFKPVTKTIPSV
ncbi:Transcription initiation factor IIB [Monocercomonoides exilis]|uniref:Transcription initiation factor IIB n=1 Tax=Monocercomonoides exilis TaxID=2049356 RepID=UPI003559ADDB|nr:Transcription initiation factor IIB [Monocercomonoides exilis]|eukprot:MONOS_5250.1-p1 / transcript=MONOS_5250.1 / gene=MONOS_5250 / organism=Monocercomonoides_exilis_PA203 / gene_product=Transcription initiation factor IIB / transcript_product=Transcription initiation factor IIB / location=Mono_scaffold00150:106031-107214(+) / protein_length=324 / sequence_SO=supercontig / SO=protein_coding / is_pseudo=false